MLDFFVTFSIGLILVEIKKEASVGLYVPRHLLMWAELIKTCFSPVAAGREAVYISYHRLTHVHVTKHPNQCSCMSEAQTVFRCLVTRMFGMSHLVCGACGCGAAAVLCHGSVTELHPASFHLSSKFKLLLLYGF